MTEPIRVGIIGASPGKGWAATSHLPAVAGLSEVELVAVATTRRQSAEAARELFGARRAYADPTELIDDPEVEAVTVAVRVPGHRTLVEQALLAGKHVYCEWPLTEDLATTRALRDLAVRSRLQTIIGLQAARSAPVRRAAELVASGGLGRSLSVSLQITSPLGGARLPQEHAYLADDASGANLLTITTGHALDTVGAVAGEIVALAAVLLSRYPQVTLIETGEVVAASSADQISISGRLANGAILSAGIFGGLAYDPAFHLAVRGEEGAVHITARPGLSSANLLVEHVAADGDRVVLAPPDPTGSLAQVPDGAPASVAQLYLDLHHAIRTGEVVGPDFGHAVRRHELIDAVRAAASMGVAQTLTVGSAAIDIEL